MEYGAEILLHKLYENIHRYVSPS